MKKGLFRKGIVFGIIVLFVVAGVIPSTVGLKREKTQIQNIGNRGYIQELIDNASDGDTIYIPSGIYYENIIVNKSISLIGEDKNTTIIDGGGNGDVVKISADWVNISGFSIQNSGGNWDDAGIALGSNNTSIFGNNIWDNPESGVIVCEYWLRYNNIINNNISNNNQGIGTYQDAVVQIDICNNTFINNRDGIRLEYSVYSVIKNNIMKDNNFGLSLIDSPNNIIEDNIFSKGGMRLSGWYGSTIKNTISNNSFYNTGLSIIFDEWGEAGENYVKDNIVNGKPLLYYYNRSNINISNESGQIILINCDNISIQNQNISKTNTGIYLLNTVDCYIINNNIEFNNEGIKLHTGSDCNIIEYNTLTNNNYGVSIGEWGYCCYNNNIYHNNFINNIDNAYNEGINIWDDGKYGNYWSDYNERYPDAKKLPFKGIWDTPYDIDGGDNKDNYPLIKQWPDSRTRTTPRTQIIVHPILHWMLERFPLLERLWIIIF